MTNRITDEEIESTIEGFVNSIYDLGENSGWLSASLDEWIDATMKELFNFKNLSGACYASNENRFDGTANTYKRVKTLVIKRLTDLSKDYKLAAIA